MQPGTLAPGNQSAAKKSSSAFLEPGAALATLTTLEALHEAVAPQHSLLSSFGAAQSADQARSALAGQAGVNTVCKPAASTPIRHCFVQLIRMTVAELALAYKASHGKAALLHTRLVALLSQPFLAAREDDEGSASSHMQLLLDLCHGEHWQPAARVCSEVLLHTRNKVRQCLCVWVAV